MVDEKCRYHCHQRITPVMMTFLGYVSNYVIFAFQSEWDTSFILSFIFQNVQTLKKNKFSCYYGFSFSKELYFSTYDETLMNSLARSNNSSISSIQNILSSLHSQLFNALNENQYDTNKWAWLYVAIEGSRKSVIFCISV